MNPYASHLEGRDSQELVSETPGRLTDLVQRLGPDGLQRSSAPGKWTVSQILCHLADTEIAFAFRLRQALAEPRHVIQPFDQDAWGRGYSKLNGRAALDTFVALRHWNIALLSGLAPDDFSKAVTHPERGDMTFRTLVETMAGHDLNHLRQLETLAEQPA
ncbi:MAG: DinB family protein [Acidobacteriaceae bacterium]|nr:DinB family protein [Acidobacteriaceae bacterium]